MDRVIGETGIVSQFDHDSQTILFDRNYDNPVIFTQPLSYNGIQPAIVRIEDIKSDRFTASIQEPRNLDGKHMKESFSYIVLEQGIWQLEDDTVLEVGTVNTDLLAPNGWENIEFTHDFADNPLTFSSVQTDNDRDFVRTRQRNTSTNGFQIAMEEEEAFNNSGHGEETVGWLAISAGSGSWSQNNYLAGTTGDKVTHNWHSIDFGNNFSRSPVVLSSIATYNESDSSGLRYGKLNNDRVDLKIQEDRTRDGEIKHTTEAVNFFALDGNNPLMASEIGIHEPFDLKSCQLDLIRIGDHESTLWSDDEFDGHICREITGDVTDFSLTLDIEQGGFDTSIAAVNPRIRVDEVESFGKMSSHVDVELDGSGAWWIGPKIDIRKNKSGGTEGWYENYVVENASRSPQEYHERLTNDGGTYLGQTNHDGATYRHYFTPHPFDSWNQFWAIRQDYRTSGSVSMDTIIDMWRNNGLPNYYITILKNNIETDGEVNGTVKMSELDIPSW